MELTSNEIKVMKASLNYEDKENQLSDNYSNVGYYNIPSIIESNKTEAKKLVKSLEEKGLASYEKQYDTMWLTEKGVNMIFDIMDKEQEENGDDKYEYEVKFKHSTLGWFVGGYRDTEQQAHEYAKEQTNPKFHILGYEVNKKEIKG